MVQFEKTVQVLNWLARRNGGRIGKLRAMKLVFFADRYHLRKHGRMVTEDEYWAMKYGPVPSTTHQAAIEGQGMARRRMNPERFLDDPPPGHNPCYLLAPEEREAARTLLRERQRILVVLGQE